MKAVRIHAHGGPEVLTYEDIPTPEPSAGEVLVRVLGVSVNHLDLWVRRGMPGVKIPFPRILGCDGTGEIVAFGPGVSGLKLGQRVVIEPGVSSGKSAYDQAGLDHLSDDYAIRGEHCDGLDCEFVALPAKYVFALPAGLDPVQAAAAPLAFLTAWGMLVSRAMAQPGEQVLVLAGASGVGSAAIQIARDLGCNVLATASTADKRTLVEALGATPIDSSKEGWEKEVKALTQGRGVDIVLEHVGPATWEGSMRSLARNGRLVTCGATTGPKVSLLLPHVFIKNLSVLGSTMGPRVALPVIFQKLAAGTYRVAVDRVFPLAHASQAHALLESRQVVGKIVLEVGR